MSWRCPSCNNIIPDFLNFFFLNHLSPFLKRGLIVFFAVISFSSLTLAQEANIYDKNYNIKYRIENNKVYDKDWNLQYRIENNKIYDKNWNLKYHIQEDKIYDRDWNLRYHKEENKIYDKHYNLRYRLDMNNQQNNKKYYKQIFLWLRNLGKTQFE